jgi:hypothetical protein
LQLCQEFGLFFGLLAFINVDSHLLRAVHRMWHHLSAPALSFRLEFG